MRSLYLTNKAFPGALSVEFSTNKDDSRNFLLSLAKSLGMSNPTEVSFEEETICDLFSEQSLLCSLIPYGIRYAFEALEKKGINKEMALNECLFESKLIIQTIEKIGFTKFFEIISPNALLGGEKAQKSMEFQSLRTLFDRLINDISTKKFYEEVDKTNFRELREIVSKDWSKSTINEVWKNNFLKSTRAKNENLDN